MGCFSRPEVEIPGAKSQATFIGTILGQIYMRNPTGCAPMGFLCDSDRVTLLLNKACKGSALQAEPSLISAFSPARWQVSPSTG